jgi:hypothetical protein
MVNLDDELPIYKPGTEINDALDPGFNHHKPPSLESNGYTISSNERFIILSYQEHVSELPYAICQILYIAFDLMVSFSHSI